ncbi:disease resistance protein RPV1-like isoform X2 [Corylus avellana]|uniref:disease resistance protein RPV1-like isoform X2 n=1 Tax=Corylus avellana TaxID=13451 RepID=UPI002869FC43|nr:disease resistance protein RPV1-like isoform X2 [Corylus avellana]
MASSMAFQAASSSPSSSFTRRWPYDVFLSFGGEYACDSFTANLYKALCEKGIHIYIDHKLQGGDEISPTLLKAIKESRTSIVVLSEKYASSTCCLAELMEILECRKTKQQIVLPVFYKVDPSEVRHQIKSFGKALDKHEERFKEDTFQRWKAALNKVANLSGWHLQKSGRNESKCVHEIVRVILRIVSHTYLKVAKYPVGLESHVQEINALLNIGESDIRMLGIFGVGGIGKTTIAKAIYNSIAYQFKDSCFLANVRESSNKESGLVQLQETLLYEIIGDSSLKVGNIHRGINVIKERLCCKRILLVLDDVDQLVQLEILSGKKDWFGLGSRIIITTRDEHLLTKHKVDLTYKMNELDHKEALQLFSRHAFQSDIPNDEFVEFTKLALRYAGGLPLALEVLGSYLYGRDAHHWKSALEKYKKIPGKDIHEKLRISYDGLEESEKNIFLDIACFFKGEDVEYVSKILESCGFFPDIGIKVLMEKSLITMDDDRLVMHDLLQDMGREIVRQESPKEPGKRSRLWIQEDIRHVLEENMNFQNMKIMEFSECHFLTKIPDMSRTPNLEKLSLFECESLVEVHDSVGFHDKLASLTIMKCSNLISLPRSLKLRSLEALYLDDCSSLQNFPEIDIEMECLRYISFSDILIKDLPSSIGYLTGLRQLYIKNCPNLMHLPSSILQLQHLEELSIENCSELFKLPTKVRDERQSLPSIVSIKESEISSSTELLSLLPPTNASNLDNGCSSTVFPALRDLDLDNCMHLSKSDFLDILDCFSALERLNLSGSDIVSLPTCIKSFVRLRGLLLNDCKQLQEVLELPPNIESIRASGCVSLESFPEVSKKFQFDTSELRALDLIDLSRCYKMLVNIGNPEANPLSDEEHLKDYFGGIIFPGNKIPDWFSYRNENSNRKWCEIDITGVLYLDEITRIAFCAVIGPIPAISPEDGILNVEVSITGKGCPTYIARVTINYLMNSDHVWLEYSTLEFSELEAGNLGFEFFVDSRSLFIKSCGVHLILDEDVDVYSDVADEEIKNSGDSIDGIQPSKRHHDDDDDDDDCDLESNWYTQHKRLSSTLGESQLNQSGNSQR